MVKSLSQSMLNASVDLLMLLGVRHDRRTANPAAE
jgi:hypothetical protein